MDETVWVAFAMEVSLSSKEKGHWKVPSIVGLTVVCCGLPSAAGAPCSDTVVGVAADDDGVVPRCPSEGTIVASVVLDVADDGALEDPVER